VRRLLHDAVVNLLNGGVLGRRFLGILRYSGGGQEDPGRQNPSE